MPDDPDGNDDRATDLGQRDGARFDAIAGLLRDFWAPRALLTAHELDLFSLLGSDRLTARRLAELAGADRRGIELLCNALTGIGVLTASDGRYANAELSRRYLDRTSEEYRGNVLRLADWWWTRWSDLTRVVRTGESTDGPPTDMIEPFTLAMHEGKPDAGERMVAALDLHGVERVIDLGCGPAAIAAAIAAERPQAHIVCVDREEVIDVARRRLPPELLESRISLVARDFLADGIPIEGDRPGSYDLGLLSSVVHLYDEADNVSLLGRLHDALAPGGRVAIRDFLVDETGTTPAQSALFAVNMLVSTSRGRVYSFGRVKEWLHGAGFGEVESRPFDGPVQLITARRA